MRQIERDMYPALLVFGDSAASSLPDNAQSSVEGDMQIRLAKMLPLLRRLQVRRRTRTVLSTS